MATQWRTPYLEICTVLMEPGALVLGLTTDEQFLRYAGEILSDFAVKTGITRNLFCVPVDFQQGFYPLPEGCAESLSAMVGQQHVWRSSGQPLDTYDAAWNSRNGKPQAWREDELPVKRIEFTPAPAWYGTQVGVFPSMTAAIVSAVSNPADFTVSPLNPGYGVVAAAYGSPFIATVNPGYGVLSRIVPSTSNIEIAGVNAPVNPVVAALSSYIELFPDAAVPYLKYGILFKIFSSDSEHKDLQKAAYCAARYQEGISALSSALLDMGG